MDVRFETTLIECLGLLDDGEPLEAILARYPAEAEQLRPLLDVATVLPTLSMAPSEKARISSRRAFLNQAHMLSEVAPPRRFWLPARLAIGLAALVLAFVFVGGTVAASGSALPGERLYSVKRAVEDTRLLLIPQSDKPSLAAQFQQRRRDEIARLLSERRAASVAFDGPIEAIQSGQWTIGGLPVRVDQATALFGTPGLGARTHVQGRTENGQLFATLIQIEAGTGVPPPVSPSAMPQPTALPRPTATLPPAPTELPTATIPLAPTEPPATATARPSATATPRPAPSPTATLPPAPTATLPPAPTATPFPPAAEPATATAEPAPEVEVEISGIVESIGSSWRVSGTTVEVDGATEIRGTISVGDTVRVRGVRLPDGRVIARRIERRDDNQNSGGSNSGGGTDDHGGGSNSGSGGGGSDGGGGGSDSGGGGGGGSGSGGG